MKKYRLVLALALVVGLLAGVFTTPAVADPEPGNKIQIPIIGIKGKMEDDLGFTLAETWIQVQAQSNATGAVVFFWDGVKPQDCPTNAVGPCGHLCLTVKDNEETWTIKDPQILSACSDGAKSAIIYFLQGDDALEACTAASGITTYAPWKIWKDKWESGSDGWIAGGQGQAVVHRRMVGPAPDLIGVVSDYVGIAPSMDAGEFVDGETRSYYAPISMDTYHGFSTVFHIQNSGQICPSIKIYYQNQETCTVDIVESVGDLAPGETIDVVVPDLGPDWLGSARIETTTALGIIVEQFGRGLLLTHRANGPWIGDDIAYADLLYREYNGWVSGIQVQNTNAAAKTWVTVEFFDNSGDFVGLYGDWLCEDGATTFYLPSVDFLGGEYIGGAAIKSFANIPLHGVELPGQPIFAVVNLQNDEGVPNYLLQPQGLSYNAHPEFEKVDQVIWDLPMIVKEQDGVTSEIAIRNNSNCTKLGARIEFYDENGRVTLLPDLTIDPDHVEIYKLGQLGALLPPGFNGAASVYFWIRADFCLPGDEGFNVAMPSVIVKQEDTLVPGGSDHYSGYEGIPVYEWHEPCKGDLYGVVSDIQDPSEPIMDVEIDVLLWDGVDAETDSNGHYEIIGIPEGGYTVTAAKTGWLTLAKPVTVVCREDRLLDFELACTNPLTVTVRNDDESMVIDGATVTVTATHPYDGTWSETFNTNSKGEAVFQVPKLKTGLQDTVYATVSKDGYKTITSQPLTVNWADALVGDCETYAAAPIPMTELATIQGRVFCDGRVSPTDGGFNPGEEQPDVLVKLYEGDGTGDYITSDLSDDNGFYQFPLLDPDISYDLFVGSTLEANDVILPPGKITVVDIDVCN